MAEDFVDHDFFDASPYSDVPSTSNNFDHSPVPPSSAKNQHLCHDLTSSSSETDSSTESTSDLHGRNETIFNKRGTSKAISDDEAQLRNSTQGLQKSAECTYDKSSHCDEEEHLAKQKEKRLKRRSTSKKKSLQKAYISRPKDGDDEGSDSVTDVSPLSSPGGSPIPPRQDAKLNGIDAQATNASDAPVNYRHITKLNVVFKDSSQTNVDAKKQNGLQFNDIHDVSGIQRQRQYHDDHWSSSSDENDPVFPERRKQQRKGKTRHDISVRNHCKRLLDSSARESMEICRLLETVLELEKQKQTRKEYSREVPLHRQFHGNPVQPRHSRKNMSFSNEQVRNIDQENQRLLKEITKVNARRSRPSSASSVRSTSTVKSNFSVDSRNSTSSSHSRLSSGRRRQSDRPVKLYHSTINRINYQRQIERENTQLLKRLQSTKPTIGMQRKSQLADYKQQAKYMGGSIDRNGMSVRRAHELTRNAEVVKETLGMKKLHQPRAAWQDSW